MRQSQSLQSVIAKFEECARTGLVMSLRKPEVIAFIRYAREVGYDLETGMVNLMARGYDADNCPENHDANNGVCDCFTGMTMDDFSGENPKDVDIAEWWGPFQFWKNSETVQLYDAGQFCEDIQDLQTCADRASNAPCSPCMRRIDNISIEAGDNPDGDEPIDGNQCPGCGNRTTPCVCIPAPPATAPPATVNQIVEINISRHPYSGEWTVAVTKEFAPEHGGGRQVFREGAGGMHAALDVARGMVTVSPGQRTDS